MDKLIITCTPFSERVQFPPEIMANMPKTIRQVADAIREAHDAGAAAVHVHTPQTKGGIQGSPFIKENYLELLHLVRQTDVIYEYRGPGPYQCGFAGRVSFGPFGRVAFSPDEWDARLEEWRAIDLGDEKPDMVNCIVGPQHMDHGHTQHHVMPTLSELEGHMQFLRRNNVKPYFEVWGAGALYNVQWLINKGLIDPPYWLELSMGIQGSSDPPANIEELLYITKKLPKDSLWLTWGQSPPRGDLTPQQLLVFLTQAITLGGHVRVGFEDCPWYWDGTPAKSNAQLVERIVRVAREIGREVATSAEAREILRIPARK